MMNKLGYVFAIIFVVACPLPTVYAMGGPVLSTQEVENSSQIHFRDNVGASEKMFGMYEKYEVEDKIDGNGNGRFDIGDYKVKMLFYAGNSSNKNINAEFMLRVNNSLLTINDNPVKYYTIPAYSEIKVPFDVSPKFNMPSDMRFVVIMKVDGKEETGVYNIHYGYTSRFAP